MSKNFVNVCVYIQDVTIFVDFGAKIGTIQRKRGRYSLNVDKNPD